MKVPKISIKTWRASRNPVWREPVKWGWFPWLVDLLGPVYTRFGLGLGRLELEGSEILARALRGVAEQEDRLLLVFRHCGDADPHGVYYALNSLAKPAYRRAGVKRPRFLFLASAEIALWGGGLTNFALRAGGTLAMAHGPGSRTALHYVRNHFRNSPDPVVMAPEGQISYELNGPLVLDSGAGNFAQWATASTAGSAKIIPIGLRYLTPDETWTRWNRFLNALEKGAGLPPWKKLVSVEADAATRLRRVWDHLLTRGESYYRQKHLRSFSPQPSLNARCRQLTRVAVEAGARSRNIAVGDDLRPSIFELRYSAMDLVFPRPRGLSLLEQAMDNRAAAEGWWNNRHQDLADLLNYLNPDSLPDHPTLELAVETALNLADFAGRLAGGTLKHRPRYFRRLLQLKIGDPILVPKDNKHSRKQRAQILTGQIKSAFEGLRKEGLP